LSGDGFETHGVGKISNIFAGRGVTLSTPTSSNDEGVSATIAALEASSGGLVFANLVDFDEKFGHRNDPAGYAAALEAFDRRLPEILGALGPDDALIVTADHGNDPTTPSTDHSRENVPLVACGPRIAPGDVPHRSSFADCGATILELLGAASRGTVAGESFAALLLSD
jgi:phosphopentomutase